MIPADVITAWAGEHPWPTITQVEQDLLLERAICEIANHDLLGEQLLFRGGTAFHKLHLPRPYRYSEDLDYVRTTPGGIKPLTRALTDLGTTLGYSVTTQIGEHPKVRWRTTSSTGVPLRIKIEINTHERSPALPSIRLPHTVSTSWWSGQAEVPTFQPPELVATKIRALYQRSKGRDLFDLWLALTQTHIDPDDILTAFHPYRPAGLTPKRAVANLTRKVHDPRFRADLDPLVTQPPTGYTIGNAADLITETLLTRLDQT